MDVLIQVLIVLSLLVLGYTIGGRREKRHYRSLRNRERKTLSLPVKSDRKFSENFSQVRLVTGTVVIGQDYFKSIVSKLRNFMGGRINSYETLLDRGRREAILRMKEQAISWGAQEIVNLRIETTSISSGKVEKETLSSSSCEVFVYASAGKN